jgi:hypothetical protein
MSKMKNTSRVLLIVVLFTIIYTGCSIILFPTQDEVDTLIAAKEDSSGGDSEETEEETNGEYSIGDGGPAGGVVFYDKGSYSDGWRYLEAAPLSAEWGGIWWYNTDIYIGGTGTDIGTGKANTSAIVAELGNGTYAAQYCNDLEFGGYDDWFLASRDELDQLFRQRDVVGDIETNTYWSSSEVDDTYVWTQKFGSGGQDDDMYWKNNSLLNVRPIRSF